MDYSSGTNVITGGKRNQKDGSMRKTQSDIVGLEDGGRLLKARKGREMAFPYSLQKGNTLI